MRLLYTCLFAASQDGGTCFDPLFFHYMDDDNLFNVADTEHSFIFANAIKVTPVLEAGATEVKSYFPQEERPWVSLTNLAETVDSSQGGDWFKLKTSVTDPEDRINAHLRPGHLIPYLHDDTKMPNSTNEANQIPLEIWANRDHQGFAGGKVFLDGGVSRSELGKGDYEYFQLELSKNSLKRLVLNEQATSPTANGQFKRLVILNAEDIKDTDFACGTFFANHTVFDLSPPQYDPKLKTLNISLANAHFFDIRDIHFGVSGKDINICNPVSQYYRTKEDKLPDLTGNTVSVELKSLQPHALRDLTLTMSVLASGALNIHWTYQNMTGVAKQPFEVPTSIVDPRKAELKEGAKLSDYIGFNQNTTGEDPFSIAVKNAQGTAVWRLDGMVMSEYFNYIDT